MPETVLEPSPMASDGVRLTWFARVKLGVLTVLRLLLGIAMLPYAYSKVIHLQFQVTAWNYAQPLLHANGRVLTWSTFGYSQKFQILLGVLELVPALLLLSARTRRLGALLMFPVLLNVTLVNYFLDLWRDTQIISSILLAINVILLAIDAPIYLRFFRSLLVRPRPIVHRGLRYTATALAILIPLAVVSDEAYESRQFLKAHLDAITDFIGERQINGTGTFRLEGVSVGGKPLALAPGSMMYFGFDKHVHLTTGGATPQEGDFDANQTAHTFRLTKVDLGGSKGEIAGKYQVDGKRLLLDGRRDGAPVAMVLVRQGW